MISHDLRTVFVHIPKTGGTSIEKAILRSLSLNWDQRGTLCLFDNHDPNDIPVAHMSGAEYVKFGHITAEQWRDYFSFAFVRNPWDRLVSEYRYRYSHARTFPEFVKYAFATNIEEDRRHVTQQSYFVDGVDFVGRFENLEQDYASVALRLGISASLEHHNAGEESKLSIAWRKLNRIMFKRDPGVPKIAYQQFYSPELRDTVGELYEEDVKAFGYKFDDSLYCTNCVMDVMQFRDGWACDCTDTPLGSNFPRTWRAWNVGDRVFEVPHNQRRRSALRRLYDGLNALLRSPPCPDCGEIYGHNVENCESCNQFSAW